MMGLASPVMPEATRKAPASKARATASDGRVRRDQLPVGVSRARVALEGPDVGDFANLLRITLDHLAVLVPRGRDQLTDEPHRQVRPPAAQVGADELRLVDADEFLFQRFAVALAIVDRPSEAVEDLPRQEIFQRRLVALGERTDDHLV